jgi:hypothetical protein
VRCPECGRALNLPPLGCAFHDAWAERAAIKEAMAKMERKKAESEAYREVYEWHLARWR